MPIDKYLEKLEGSRVSKKILNPLPIFSIENTRRYIILEGKLHETYSYPDLLVSMGKSHHGKNWYETHQALYEEDSFMLNLRQYVDFLKLLKNGKAFDENGNLIEPKILELILDDIFEKRDPLRGEWIDALFNINNNLLYIKYDNRIINGDLIPGQIRTSSNHLLKGAGIGINLDDWLNTATIHGLPPRKIKNGELDYYACLEENNCVAWFYADSVGAFLSCNRDPSSSDPVLGVRHARIRSK